MRCAVARVRAAAHCFWTRAKCGLQRKTLRLRIRAWSIALPRNMQTLFRSVLILLLVVALLISGPLLVLAFGSVPLKGDGSNAGHRSTGQAPDAATTPAAVVQVYASRTFSWRGAFAVHTWLAAKPEGAD